MTTHKVNENDYYIYVGDVLIAFARNVDDDMPDVIGTLEPTAEFERFRSLFDKEYELLDAGNYDERRRVMEEIFEMGLRLESPIHGTIYPCTGQHALPGGLFTSIYMEAKCGRARVDLNLNSAQRGISLTKRFSVRWVNHNTRVREPRATCHSLIQQRCQSDLHGPTIAPPMPARNERLGSASRATNTPRTGVKLICF